MVHHPNTTALMNNAANPMRILTRRALSKHVTPQMGRAAQKKNHYHCTHNRLTYHNSSCRRVLQGTNRFRSCHIITQVFLLQKIEDCSKTPIQSTTAKLNTTDGSPMSAIGTTALHLRIAEFKFTPNFIICDQLRHRAYLGH